VYVRERKLRGKLTETVYAKDKRPSFIERDGLRKREQNRIRGVGRKLREKRLCVGVCVCMSVRENELTV